MSSRLPRRLVDQLRAAAGRPAVLTDPADCWVYGYDNSRLHALPDAVVLAATHEQVAAIVGLCSAAGVPVTTRGRGTGTTGATVPVDGGVVLSLERMNRILAIEPRDRIARVEPGVTNQALQDAAAAHGFFWPPDPTSAAVCTIGGNLGCNAAGPRAIKYGTTRENTLGLRAVTGAGEEIRTGVMTTKGVVGYDFTRLLIGSEGTLAVITEATLKLTPLPEARHTLQATYRSVGAAAAAVSAIMARPVTPCALEFMDRGAGGVGRPEEAVGGDGVLQGLIGDAGLHADDPVPRLDGQDAVHPLQREHHAAAHRHGGASGAGAAAARDERHACCVAEADDRSDLLVGRRQHDRVGQGVQPAVVVAVGPAVGGVGEHGGSADGRPQPVSQSTGQPAAHGATAQRGHCPVAGSRTP